MNKLGRYIVAFASVLLGIAASVAVAALELQDRPPPVRLPHGQQVQDPEETQMIFGWCVVFYATTYCSGNSSINYSGRARIPKLWHRSRAGISQSFI